MSWSNLAIDTMVSDLTKLGVELKSELFGKGQVNLKSVKNDLGRIRIDILQTVQMFDIAQLQGIMFCVTLVEHTIADVEAQRSKKHDKRS